MNAAQPLLSATLIVRDEERVLEACLSSLDWLVDEIIVVDTGSTDRSAELAARHGAKVFNFAWSDDFSAARNACLDRVKGEWVLWLDAGETIDPTISEEIRRFVSWLLSTDLFSPELYYLSRLPADIDSRETVAVVLSSQFGIPAENLTTQGYGKQFLKVPTDGPERANRRVAVRRITPLLAGQG